MIFIDIEILDEHCNISQTKTINAEKIIDIQKGDFFTKIVTSTIHEVVINKDQTPHIHKNVFLCYCVKGTVEDIKKLIQEAGE